MFGIWGHPKYKIEYTIKDANNFDETKYFYSDSWLWCKWRMYKLDKEDKKPIMKYRNY